MRYVKPRKPRGRKLNGEMSEDFCTGCKMRGCDPFGNSELYINKLNDRRKRGVCTACGQMPCVCKSSLSAKTEVLVVHNNKKAKREEVARHNTLTVSVNRLNPERLFPVWFDNTFAQFSYKNRDYYLTTNGCLSGEYKHGKTVKVFDFASEDEYTDVVKEYFSSDNQIMLQLKKGNLVIHSAPHFSLLSYHKDKEYLIPLNSKKANEAISEAKEIIMEEKI